MIIVCRTRRAYQRVGNDPAERRRSIHLVRERERTASHIILQQSFLLLIIEQLDIRRRLCIMYRPRQRVLKREEEEEFSSSPLFSFMFDIFVRLSTSCCRWPKCHRPLGSSFYRFHAHRRVEDDGACRVRWTPLRSDDEINSLYDIHLAAEQ